MLEGLEAETILVRLGNPRCIHPPSQLELGSSDLVAVAEHVESPLAKEKECECFEKVRSAGRID
jgi:hypothetical protein